MDSNPLPAPTDPRLQRLAEHLLSGWAVLATEALLAGDLQRAQRAADQYAALREATPAAALSPTPRATEQ